MLGVSAPSCRASVGAVLCAVGNVAVYSREPPVAGWYCRLCQGPCSGEEVTGSGAFYPKNHSTAALLLFVWQHERASEDAMCELHLLSVAMTIA